MSDQDKLNREQAGQRQAPSQGQAAEPEMPMLAASAAARLTRDILSRLSGPHAAPNTQPLRGDVLWRQVTRRLGGTGHGAQLGTGYRAVQPPSASALPPLPHNDLVWRVARHKSAQHDTGDSGWTEPSWPVSRPAAQPQPPAQALEPESSAPSVAPSAFVPYTPEGLAAPPAEPLAIEPQVPEAPGEPAAPVAAEPVAPSPRSAPPAGETPEAAPPVFVPPKVVRVEFVPGPAIEPPRPLAEPRISVPEPTKAMHGSMSRHLHSELNREIVPTTDLLSRMSFNYDVEVVPARPRPAQETPSEAAAQTQAAEQAAEQAPASQAAPLPPAALAQLHPTPIVPLDMVPAGPPREIAPVEMPLSAQPQMQARRGRGRGEPEYIEEAAPQPRGFFGRVFDRVVAAFTQPARRDFEGSEWQPVAPPPSPPAPQEPLQAGQLGAPAAPAGVVVQPLPAADEVRVEPQTPPVESVPAPIVEQRVAEQHIAQTPTQTSFEQAAPESETKQAFAPTRERVTAAPLDSQVTQQSVSSQAAPQTPSSAVSPGAQPVEQLHTPARHPGEARAELPASDSGQRPQPQPQGAAAPTPHQELLTQVAGEAASAATENQPTAYAPVNAYEPYRPDAAPQRTLARAGDEPQPRVQGGLLAGLRARLFGGVGTQSQGAAPLDMPLTRSSNRQPAAGEQFETAETEPAPLRPYYTSPQSPGQQHVPSGAMPQPTIQPEPGQEAYPEIEQPQAQQTAQSSAPTYLTAESYVTEAGVAAAPGASAATPAPAAEGDLTPPPGTQAVAPLQATVAGSADVESGQTAPPQARESSSTPTIEPQTTSQHAAEPQPPHDGSTPPTAGAAGSAPVSGANTPVQAQAAPEAAPAGSDTEDAPAEDRDTIRPFAAQPYVPPSQVAGAPRGLFGGLRARLFGGAGPAPLDMPWVRTPRQRQVSPDAEDWPVEDASQPGSEPAWSPGSAAAPAAPPVQHAQPQASVEPPAAQALEVAAPQVESGMQSTPAESAPQSEPAVQTPQVEQVVQTEHPVAAPAHEQAEAQTTFYISPLPVEGEAGSVEASPGVQAQAGYAESPLDEPAIPGAGTTVPIPPFAGAESYGPPYAGIADAAESGEATHAEGGVWTAMSEMAEEIMRSHAPVLFVHPAGGSRGRGFLDRIFGGPGRLFEAAQGMSGVFGPQLSLAASPGLAPGISPERVYPTRVRVSEVNPDEMPSGAPRPPAALAQAQAPGQAQTYSPRPSLASEIAGRQSPPVIGSAQPGGQGTPVRYPQSASASLARSAAFSAALEQVSPGSYLAGASRLTSLDGAGAGVLRSLSQMSASLGEQFGVDSEGAEGAEPDWARTLREIYGEPGMAGMPLAHPYGSFAVPSNLQGASLETVQLSDVLGGGELTYELPARTSSMYVPTSYSVPPAAAAPEPEAYSPGGSILNYSWGEHGSMIDAPAGGEAGAWANVVTSAVSGPQATGAPALALSGEERPEPEYHEGGEGGEHEAEGGDPDLDELAETIYSIIKMKLIVERERSW